MEPSILDYASSIELQRKYIINGTKDEYIVPEELLNDLNMFIERKRRKKQSSQISKALTDLDDFIDSFKFDDFPNNEKLVYSDSWIELRRRCRILKDLLNETKL